MMILTSCELFLAIISLCKIMFMIGKTKNCPSHQKLFSLVSSIKPILPASYVLSVTILWISSTDHHTDYVLCVLMRFVSYIMMRVLDSTWLELEEQLEKATDVDSMVQSKSPEIMYLSVPRVQTLLSDLAT